MMLRPQFVTLVPYMFFTISLPALALSATDATWGEGLNRSAIEARDFVALGLQAETGFARNNVLILAQTEVEAAEAQEVEIDPGAYSWSVELQESGEIRLDGDVPSEGFGNFLKIRAGEDAVNDTSEATGAPEGFSGMSVAAVNAVKALMSGRIAYENEGWSLNGYVDSLATRQSVLEALGQSADLIKWNITLQVASTAQNMDPEDLADSASPADSVAALNLCVDAVAGFAQTHTILFAPASAQLTEESETALPLLAQELTKCPNVQVHVAGHTDADGPANDNMTLSVRRAESVVDALIAAGVSDSRLYAIGYGETLPIATNDTRAGKALNRRIVFELKPQEER